MAFGDYASSFSGLKPSNLDAFNFGGSSGFNLAGGAKTGMDPFSIALGVGQLGASIFGGMAGQQAAADSIRAQNAAANAGTEAGARIAREQTYGQLGELVAARNYGATVAPELEFGRQLRAANIEYGPLGEKRLGVASEVSRRQRQAAISPETKEGQLFQNLLKLKSEQAGREGTMAAMFGPKSPTNVSRMVV